ncbi:MAG: methyltransferase domain-containing protein [Pseudomonadota bacterium]
MSETREELESLYRHRFPEEELANKHAIWRVLCRRFFSRYVKPTDTVVDIGAGYCEFINNIDAARKIAVDLNPEVARFANAGVQVLNESCTGIANLPSGTADAVFMSNFLEHLPSKQMVLDTFREAHRILKPSGRIIVLQPNIRFLYAEYWDFFDHHTALSDRSLVEGLQLAGFAPDVVIPRFLPYTTKSRLPQAPWLVSLYLRFPPMWRILGKQTLVVAGKARAAT